MLALEQLLAEIQLFEKEVGGSKKYQHTPSTSLQ